MSPRQPSSRDQLPSCTRISARSGGGITVVAVLGAAVLLAVRCARAADATPQPEAAPVTVHAAVDHPQATIGDPIRYTVTISAAQDVELVVPVLAGQLGDFTISDFGEVPAHKENGRVTLARWYTLTTFTAGDHTIPKPTIQYRSGGASLHDAAGNEVPVTVLSLLAQEPSATDIRDIKPPEELPFDWTPYVLAAGALALVAALCGVLFFLVNRPRRRRLVPSRPAHEIALAALNRLRVQRLVEHGRFEEYYIQLSAIVRAYLEDRFRLRAPEMTTEEFLGVTAADSRLIAAHRRLLTEFLSQADLVKFARHLPSLHDSEAAYEAARRFVEETRAAIADGEVRSAAA